MPRREPRGDLVIIQKPVNGKIGISSFGISCAIATISREQKSLVCVAFHADFYSWDLCQLNVRKAEFPKMFIVVKNDPRFRLWQFKIPSKRHIRIKNVQQLDRYLSREFERFPWSFNRLGKM